MRSLLALAAAVGFPLYALAQPVADDGKPTEVSGLVVEGRAGNCMGPTHPFGPNRLLDAPPATKAKRTEESAGTRAFVLMVVAGVRNDTIDYTHIHPGLAKLVRAQAPRVKGGVLCQGVLKDIRFLHVSQDGWDDFEVDFSNGALEWAVKPFNARQMIEGLVFRPFYPQPATSRLQDLLTSMGRGHPNYADLAPDAASRLQAQWPALQKSLKDWGRWKGFRFVRQGDGGSYVYQASYEHRQVVWTAFSPNADGKLTALRYDEKAG